MQDQASTLEFAALYCHHHGWLRAWLQRRLGDAQDAADLAHDTFTRVFAARSIGEIREPRAYLTTIARGILVNWFERQALERAYLDSLSHLPPSHAPSPEQQHVILETLQQVDALLNSLPVHVRHAFLLSQIEGLRYEDIARQLGCSLISVKRYMKQAFLQCLTLLDC